MNGKDKVVLRDTASLTRFGDVHKALFLLEKPRGAIVNKEDPLPYLNNVTDLMIDAQRRVRENRPRFELESISGLDTDQQIKILIEHLDEASARQMMQPGGISLTSDPIAHKLYEIGESSIDPLFDVFDTDNRLTRSVSYHRNFFPSRRIHSVKDTAMSIILAILDYPAFTRGPDGNNAIEDLKEYWSKYRGLTSAERFYAVLADNDSTPKQWLKAATSMTDWASVDRSTGWIRWIPAKPGEPLPPMKGEPLRDGREHSVTHLMTKRISQMKGDGALRSTSDISALSDAFRMAGSLYKWDPASTLPPMRELTVRLKDVLENNGSYRNYLQGQITNLSFATVVRMRLGDDSAASDYAEIVENSQRSTGYFNAEPFFAPLILFPEDPVLESLSERLFGSDESVWHPKNLRFILSIDELTSRLISIEPYREAVIGLLDDKTVVGEVWLDSDSLKYETPGGGSGGSGPILDNLLEGRKIGKGRSKLRTCDAVAYNYSRLKGAPLFLPLWNEEEKTEAIRKIKEFIRENCLIIHTLASGYRGESAGSWMTSEPIERR